MKGKWRKNNMRKRIILTISISLFTLISCSSQKTIGELPYGSYSYRSYNFLGDLVGDGTLYINNADSTAVTGNWNIREVRECLNCGAQFGSGFLIGFLENDTLRINLNPDNTNIDTELIGKFGDGTFDGKWKWTNREGFGFSGTFKAARM
jgi:hypothetical protein